ncbi:HET-domain-containing protein, partial [Thozetella sp. PMI_491]
MACAILLLSILAILIALLVSVWFLVWARLVLIHSLQSSDYYWSTINAIDYVFLYSYSILGLISTSDRPLPELDLSRDSLRLVHLLPGSGSWPIEVELSSHNFLAVPRYEALSYTWGPPERTRYIWVNHHPTSVTANLFAALRHLRHPRNERLLWIDALCINQTSSAEKSHQIPLMAFIYSRAQQGIAWLLPRETVSELDVYMFKRWLKSDGRSLDDAAWLQNHRWVYQLLHQDYWKRMWVIQEMLKAPNLVIQFGVHTFQWSEFYDIARM